MLFKTNTLKSYKLKGKDGEIGGVKDFYFDDKHWAIRYLVADTGNWLTGRQVLVSPYSLVSINEEEENIVVNLSEKQIEECPPLDSDKPVSRQYEMDYSKYFEYPEYWHGRLMWGAFPYVRREYKDSKTEKQHEMESWDPHLRSTKDVTGHHIEAKDGEIGHVEGFIIDDKNWAIRYLVINTKNWWGGKKVLISPQWIDRISWDKSKVFINLTRERIKQSPEYTDDTILTRDYEELLHQHYEHTGYWIH